ncbi:MAG: damage-control phosphatase ARMT1 family protein [Thermoplasmata archaeon]
MKIHSECVPCLLKRSLYEARLIDKDKKRKVIKEALKILEENFQESSVSTEVSTKVHDRVYKILGTDDPYKDLKKKSNETAEKLLPKAEKVVENGGFREAVLVSIAGNVMDFGYRDDIDSPDFLIKEFQNIIDEGFGHDDIERIEKLLKKGKNILYFTDNAGEIVFDTLLLKKIKEFDVHLTVVVKEAPILTDATIEDADKYKIDKIADQVDTTGGFAVGVNFVLISEDLKEKLERADLIIAKGMANWESFSEKDYRPIAFLTRSKCNPVSETMGVPFDTNVAKLFE